MFSACFGLVLVMLVLGWVPETRTPALRQPLSLIQINHAYKSLLTTRRLWRYACVPCVALLPISYTLLNHHSYFRHKALAFARLAIPTGAMQIASAVIAAQCIGYLSQHQPGKFGVVIGVLVISGFLLYRWLGVERHILRN